MRSLCLLPGGLARFVPCSFGANHCRLRQIGWEKCGHGLTSRPRESASRSRKSTAMSTVWQMNGNACVRRGCSERARASDFSSDSGP